MEHGIWRGGGGGGNGGRGGKVKGKGEWKGRGRVKGKGCKCKLQSTTKYKMPAFCFALDVLLQVRPIHSVSHCVNSYAKVLDRKSSFFWINIVKLN
jgi:hypothetical protein